MLALRLTHAFLVGEDENADSLSVEAKDYLKKVGQVLKQYPEQNTHTKKSWAGVLPILIVISTFVPYFLALWTQRGDIQLQQLYHTPTGLSI